MHNKTSNKTSPQSQLLEGLQYKDLEDMIKPTVHVDEFASKMGDDEDIIVLSFFVRSKQAARDLMAWFEKGYDFVLDADTSPGEVKPNRFLVYVELRRRNAAPQQVAELLDDLSTLTEHDPSDWTMHYDGKDVEFSAEEFACMFYELTDIPVKKFVILMACENGECVVYEEYEKSKYIKLLSKYIRKFVRDKLEFYGK